MTGGAYSYLFGPVVALIVVIALGFLLRWAFGRGGSLVERTPHRGSADEYGLLVAVRVPRDAADGERIRLMLEEHGIRATVTVTVDGPRVMVFPGDEDRARALLAGY